MEKSKFSFDKKLFFLINKRVGTNKIMDSFMFVCAQWLIFFLGAGAISWAVAAPEYSAPGASVTLIKLTLAVVFLSLATNWVLGMVFHHRRPIVDFPQTKQLFEAIQNWKSFPSDHAAAAFAMFFMLCRAGIDWKFGILAGISAVLVALGRVYAGVHYPKDIVGGAAVAGFYVWIAPWLWVVAVSPFFDWLTLIFT